MSLLIKKTILSFCIFIFSICLVFGQKQTVGLFLNTPEASDGYVLLAASPHDEATYLIDNCGRIVHSWAVTQNTSGRAAQLMVNGNLLRITTMKEITGTTNFGWGRLEMIDWDGNLLWEYTYGQGQQKQMHHDVEVMPNGNLLFLAYEFKNTEELLAKGRIVSPKVKNFWVDHIVEIKPKGENDAEIVWEWHAWDHMVQNSERTKDNFGNPFDNQDKININYPEDVTSQEETWLHMNSISYNPDKDEIIVSVKNFSEFWIIDHSTSTEEAAGSTGGKKGKGGDLLFRWGNNASFGYPNEKILYDQHDAHWIPKGQKGEGNVLIFNNGFNRTDSLYSSIVEIKLNRDSSGKYISSDLVWEYIAEKATDFYSVNFSNAERMSNGNTFITEGASGKLFEVNAKGKKVWEYVSPVQYGKAIKQGEKLLSNLVFKSQKYRTDYPAFRTKKLIPKGYIEINPIIIKCTP